MKLCFLHVRLVSTTHKLITKYTQLNSSSPDSLTADRMDKSSSTSPSPTALYKQVIALLRCEVSDIRDAAANALSLINQDALKYVSLAVYAKYGFANLIRF